MAQVTTGFSMLCPSCGMPVELPSEHEQTLGTDVGHEATLGRPLPEGEGYEGLLAPAQTLDEIGRLGDYRILELLGQGGMGFVFRAEDTKLRRVVALKVMRPENIRSSIARQRFLREAQAAASLSHDHILSVHAVAEVNGVVFMLMPLLNGETLHQRLERDRTLPIPEVVRVGREAADGLAAAHERGLIHRDIKPANLWLEAPKGRVKILDFGLARRHDHSDLITSTGQILGSPSYMAPEQAASGESVDFRADLFSLGCVLYQAATGRRAFPGNDVMAILSALANHVPPPADRINPAVPAALSKLIARLLEKNPALRPASARAVADALATISTTSTASTTAASSAPGRTSGDSATLVTRSAELLRGRRRPSRAQLLVGAVSLLVIALAIVIWREARSDAPKDPPKPPPAVTSDPDAWNREVAEAILKAGGVVEIRPPGQTTRQLVRAVADLPETPFRLRVVAIGYTERVNDLLRMLHDLEELNRLEVGDCPLRDDGLAQLVNLPHLHQVLLTNTAVRGPGLRSLSKLPSLSYLVLERCPIADDSLESIGELRGLTVLNIIGSSITGEGLPHLAGLEKLERLYFTQSRLTDEGLAKLPALPQLHTLGLTRNFVSDRCLDGLVARQPRLAVLGTNETDMTLEAVERLREKRPGLQANVTPVGKPVDHFELGRWVVVHGGRARVRLADMTEKTIGGKDRALPAGPFRILELELDNVPPPMSAPPFSDGDLARLTDQWQLESLRLNGLPGLTARCLDHIKGLPRLTRLSLGHPPDPAKWLGRLREFPQLEEVSIEGKGIAEADLDGLRHLPNLKRLRIAFVPLSGTFLPTSDQAPKVEHVELAVTSIDAPLLRRLGELGYPRSLAFTKCAFGPEALAQLGGLKHLTRLEFNGTPLRDVDLDQLKGLSELRHLKLAGTQVSEAGAAKLREALGRRCEVEVAPGT